MAASEDEWSDCEESTVIVEVQGVMVPDFLQKVEKARFLGIDTDSPYLQLDDKTFTGTYTDTMGTCLLFKDITDTKPDDIEDEDEVKLEYLCKTHKKLSMQRVFMKPKVEETPVKSPRHSTQENEGEESEMAENIDKPHGAERLEMPDRAMSDLNTDNVDRTTERTEVSKLEPNVECEMEVSENYKTEKLNSPEKTEDTVLDVTTKTSDESENKQFVAKPD